MAKIGLLFPGQGAQYVGMGKEWMTEFESARKIYEEGDRLFGGPLSRMCFEGPEETLTRTLYAQPAIFVTSLALFSVLSERGEGFKADFVAGLSLGEFTALVAAGSLSFSDGLKLVKTRAELMEKAARESQGTMVSILGLTQEQCEGISKETGAEVANLNAPDQFVLSGPVPAVEKAAVLAEERGAKRAIPLKVGGAFHSSLMAPAKRGLLEELKKTKIEGPRCLFAPNALAKAAGEPETIRRLLGEQLTSPVRWIETMNFAASRGIRRFIELGPGRVLKGLAKRIDPSLEVFSFEKISDLTTLESIFEKA